MKWLLKKWNRFNCYIEKKVRNKRYILTWYCVIFLSTLAIFAFTKQMEYLSAVCAGAIPSVVAWFIHNQTKRPS